MLGIIINKKSGKRAIRAQRLYLWKLLKARHEPFTYHITQFPNHALELARELAEKGYDRILVFGGDGTLSEAINGIMRADITPEQRARIQFGLIPRGTGNDWARFWGLNKDFRRSLHYFFEEGKCQPLDVGCVTYWRNGIEHHRYFINSVGFGVDAVTCVQAIPLKYYLGSHHVNYLIGLLLAVFRHKSMHVNLFADGKIITKDLMFTMNIGNGPFSGGGMKQNPDADPRDGIFHAMFVGKPTFKDICKAIPKLFSGKILEVPVIHSFTAKDIVVDTKKHIVIEADGIILDFMGPCEVHCLHNALCMTVPSYC